MDEDFAVGTFPCDPFEESAVPAKLAFERLRRSLKKDGMMDGEMLVTWGQSI